MTGIAEPSLDEKYLIACLDDPSGIELCELLWVDEEQVDGCFRVRDYQWTWFRNTNKYQIDHAGRDLGKTLSIRMRGFAFPFNYPGQDMLITAPELNHLNPITDKIESDVRSHRLTREMLPRRRGDGIKHQPQFQVEFTNKSHIVTRLPQRDGHGLKGQHALLIEFDEAQDMPHGAYVEIIEAMKGAVPGAQFRAHGVSRGVRDDYYRYTMSQDPDIPFYVHRKMAMLRPSWGDEERRDKIALYGGSADNIDYARNIYGDHGDVQNPLFVLHRLMACVRQHESTWATAYNEDVYACVKVNDEVLRASGSPIQNFISLPSSHLSEEYTSYWAGADVGYTADPTEILVFGDCPHPADKKASLLRLLARIHLMRISAAEQAEVVRFVFDFYGARLRAFGIDRTGNGLPLWQELDPEAVGTNVALRRTPSHISARMKGYNFSAKVAVEFDDRPLEGRENDTDALIEKNVVDWASDELRKLVDAKPPTIELPWDTELLTEWQGQQVQYVRDESKKAGVRRRYTGRCHTLDAGRMMIAARNLSAIEAILKKARQPAEPVLDRLG